MNQLQLTRDRTDAMMPSIFHRKLELNEDSILLLVKWI